MAKRLDSVYQAGQRNFNWIKYKASYSSALTDTLDCVLIGYWRGQGKRTPWGIGALLSAVWDADEQVFKSIARIGTGYSDEEWVRIRERLDEIAVADRPANVHSDVVPDVWTSPEIVVEVLADELTRSPMHVAGRTDDELGLALRFPRVIGFVREDKAACRRHHRGRSPRPLRPPGRELGPQLDYAANGPRARAAVRAIRSLSRRVPIPLTIVSTRS